MCASANDEHEKARKGIAPSFVATLADKGLTDLLTEQGEMAFDMAFSDGVMQDIPFLSGVAKLAKLGLGVKDYLFIKKIISFLNPTNVVSSKARDEFKKRVEEDHNFRKKVGENLLLLIERADDMSKPELTGRAFRAYLEGWVTYDQFARVGAAYSGPRFSDHPASYT